MHAQRAAAEGAAALRALLDAATLAARGEPANAGRLAPLAQALEQVAAWLHAGRRAERRRRAARARRRDCDAEIARWEARSKEDPEARSVLRAFLAVREVLFEVSARFAAPRKDEPAPPASDAADTDERPQRPARRQRARRRVERVAVEG